MNIKKTKKAPASISELKAEVKSLKLHLKDVNTESDKVFELQEEHIHKLELENAKLKYENAKLENQISNMHLENSKRWLENNRDKAKTFNEDIDRMSHNAMYLIMKNEREERFRNIEGFNIPMHLVATWESDALRN